VLFKNAWDEFDGTSAAVDALVRRTLGSREIWGEDLNDLPSFAAAVATHLKAILDDSPRGAMAAANGG
jgi:mannitol-1-phosphate/altronate dehydrogenase